MSIKYYNDNAEKFIENTFNLSMKNLIDQFICYLPEKGTVLDLGCGSGRDSIYFKEKGFNAFAMDASEMMVEHAKKYLGNQVKLATFESYTSNIKFDGIWALASLLHVPRKNLVAIIKKYTAMLNNNGIFFMSFKDRNEDHEDHGRKFTNLDELALMNILQQVENIEILKIIHTEDVREDRSNEKWISVIIRNIG